MPTFEGRNIITIPAYPPAPQSIEVTAIDVVGQNVSPFTGQQQVYDWNASWLEASVTMPPMTDATAQAWVQFLKDLKGVANVFQFTAGFQAAFPLSIPNGWYWSLKSNERKWSITKAAIYGMQFDIRRAF